MNIGISINASISCAETAALYPSHNLFIAVGTSYVASGVNYTNSFPSPSIALI